MDEKIKIELLNSDLSTITSLDFVQNIHSGGVVTFAGNVRNHSQGKEVLYLEFEAYEAMALQVLNEIAIEAIHKFNLDKIYVAHRLGKVSLGEAAVIISTASAHRGEAFEGTKYIIDQLKERAPIWKHEYWEDGSHWVNAHP